MMLYDLQTSAVYYMDFYRDYAVRWWGSIGPAEYGTLLVGTLVFGYYLLKSANRK